MNAATAARTAAGLTIMEAAKASGLCDSTIRNLEAERQSPSVSTLVILGKTYGREWHRICPESFLSAPEVTE